MGKKNKEIISDSWGELKRFTDARIALGRTGTSIPTDELLSFQLAHAKARDSVFTELDEKLLQRNLKSMGFKSLIFETRASHRIAYLKNPELGKRLGNYKIQELKKIKIKDNDISIILADGLSARAIQENSIPFLKEFIDKKPKNWTLAPIAIVKQARVAIGDEIGNLMKSIFSLILVGERPGLSSPNSMGAYLTFNPKIGRKDSERNCISNIRPEGLSYENAVKKAIYLIKEAMHLGLTGVNLKDDMDLLLESNPIKKLI